AFTYVATSIVPATGLIQLLYDPHRNLVYALTSTQIDVFNPATSQFVAPLVPDSTPGVNYVEMALTPDGSKLLLADATNSTLTVFNPDNPASHTVTVLTQSPQSLATTSTGKAFLSCGLGLIEFDLATLTSTLRQSISFLGAMKLAASPDGTHMVGALGNNTAGTVVVWNSATDTFISQGFIDGLFNDIAIANDGSQFAPISGGGFDPGITGVFFDSQLHLINATTYPDLAPPDAVQAEGAIFSPAGSVLLQPMLNAIEFFDTSSGQLRARMMMPEPLVNKTIPFASTGVAVDPSGQTVFVISASGLTLIHLPTPIDQLGGVAWPLSTSHSFSQAKFTGALNRQKHVFRTIK
ncbi:MAG TPA: hypothetical protein VGP65_18585, partial [Candidatus Angelobacter sp.]|nr:hypothetical protein [Candidatus Angelobacter sp.]